MHLPLPDIVDSRAQRAADRQRLAHAARIVAAGVALLVAVFALQPVLPMRAWSIAPGTLHGLWPGLLTAPLLHGGVDHLLSNVMAWVLLGGLAFLVYPRASARALPLLWIGGGLGAWLLGTVGSHHLGGSGVTHGLAYLVFVLGLLRRDRAGIAATMIAFAFYGGMLLTILPRELGVSWQAHLGGAVAGVVAAVLLRRADPLPPPQRYSWELEDEGEEERVSSDDATLEPPRPEHVPVLWTHTVPPPASSTDNVLPFPTRPPTP